MFGPAAILLLQAALGAQFLKCDGYTVATGSGGMVDTRIFSIGEDSIRQWNNDKLAWGSNKCAAGGKCTFSNLRYVAEDNYVSSKGSKVAYELVFNRETGEAKETMLATGTGVMFSGQCKLTENPATRQPVTKF